ncbi:MAG: RNA methyltransferase [Oscillatoriales cyanobacterium SM2_1_8]|nr:RNA methyltransferase [Oscillatoriales cyanobacterium SM2_1_8]
MGAPGDGPDVVQRGPQVGTLAQNRRRSRRTVVAIAGAGAFPLPKVLTSGWPRCRVRNFLAVPRLEVPHLLSQDLGETVAIATGPEGGWTPEEEQRAISAGFRLVSLGRRVLTAVLAPVVATALVVAKWEHDETPLL